MGSLSGFKYKDVAKRLNIFGFYLLREAKGSHQIWYNKEKNLFTTLPKHSGDLPEGTLRAILKQANIKPSEFLNQK